MKIGRHHQWTDKDYHPSMPWSDDTYVQWGSNGLVLAENCYTTAFFEAFPEKGTNAGGFIRGEGATINDAEIDAYKKYVAEMKCDHLWGRGSYKNGVQICRHCKANRTGFIKPIVVLGQHRKPLSKWENYHLDLAIRTSNSDIPSMRALDTSHAKILQIRKNLFGVEDK